MSSPVITILGGAILGVGLGDFEDCLGDLLMPWADYLRFYSTLWDWVFVFLGVKTMDLADLFWVKVLSTFLAG